MSLCKSLYSIFDCDWVEKHFKPNLFQSKICSNVKPASSSSNRKCTTAAKVSFNGNSDEQHSCGVGPGKPYLALLRKSDTQWRQPEDTVGGCERGAIQKTEGAETGSDVII